MLVDKQIQIQLLKPATVTHVNGSPESIKSAFPIIIIDDETQTAYLRFNDFFSTIGAIFINTPGITTGVSLGPGYIALMYEQLLDSAKLLIAELNKTNIVQKEDSWNTQN